MYLGYEEDCTHDDYRDNEKEAIRNPEGEIAGERARTSTDTSDNQGASLGFWLENQIKCCR